MRTFYSNFVAQNQIIKHYAEEFGNSREPRKGENN